MNQLRMIKGTWIATQKPGFMMLRMGNFGFVCPLTGVSTCAKECKDHIEIDGLFCPAQGECDRIGLPVHKEH